MLKSNRILSLDVLKIIAITMVVMIHSVTNLIVNVIPPSSEFIFANILDSFSRAGAPLFFMISGALILDEDKKYDDKKLFNKVKQILFLLISWNLIYGTLYSIIIPLYNRNSISLDKFIHACTLGWDHLWFLYAILGIYLTTPILRLFVKKENINKIKYFIIIAIIFNFIASILDFLTTLNVEESGIIKSCFDKFEMGFFSNYITYYLLGWYITNKRISKNDRKCIYILGIFSVIMCMFLTYIYTNDNCNAYEIFYSDKNIFSLLYSTSIFVFIFYRLNKKSIKNKIIDHLITNLSKLSFGVYVIHLIVLDFADKLLFSNIPYYLTILKFIFVLITSYFISYIMSKIPGIKKIIKY